MVDSCLLANVKDRTLDENSAGHDQAPSGMPPPGHVARARWRALARQFGIEEKGLDKEDVSERRQRVKALIRFGKKTGFVTHKQILSCAPLSMFDEEALEGIVSVLNDMIIAVYEKAPDAATLLTLGTGTCATIGELIVDDEEIEFNEGLTGLPPILTRPIKDFDLPEDIAKPLREAGISRVADLAYSSQAELLKAPGINEEILGRIRDEFLHYGVRVGEGACSAVASVCSQKWDALWRTDDPKVRFCAHCSKDVHRCESTNDLVDALLERHCVAVIHDRPMISSGGPMERSS
jgi:hypothetical protein